MKCPKCGGEDVIVQREQISSKSESTFVLVNNNHHGIIWWLFIGWWWRLIIVCLKFVLAVCTLGLSLPFTKRKKSYSAKGFTNTKSQNNTVAVCQNCGKAWHVKDV